MISTKRREELDKLRFEYAWRFFDFHAKQRITMFNFFVVLVPFLCGGYFYNLKADGSAGAHVLFSFMIAALGLILTITFHFFDVRNRQLYRISQTNLRLIENNYLYRAGELPLLLRANDKKSEFPGIVILEERNYGPATFGNVVIKHGFLIGFIHFVSGLVFAFLAVYAFGLHRGWYV